MLGIAIHTITKPVVHYSLGIDGILNVHRWNFFCSTWNILLQIEHFNRLAEGPSLQASEIYSCVYRIP